MRQEKKGYTNVYGNNDKMIQSKQFQMFFSHQLHWIGNFPMKMKTSRHGLDIPQQQQISRQ